MTTRLKNHITINVFRIVIVLCILCTIHSCKKYNLDRTNPRDYEAENYNPQVPSVTTSAPTIISRTSATIGGAVSFDGNSKITSRGICYSLNLNPTIADNKEITGGELGDFAINLSGLIPNTTYNVRAFATNAIGPGYGTNMVFTTLDLPILTTTAISALGSTSVSSGGNITSNGGAPITARGVCWNAAVNPTTVNSKTIDGSGGGSFTSNIAGLAPCTTYHVRAYATNSVGTAYGNDIQFTTGTVLPTITTTAISAITFTTSSSGGNVTGDCAATVTARGVCWSISPNPTIVNSHTTDGNGSGNFASILTNLLSGTKYYIRAYATNGGGTAYGNEFSFTTSACNGFQVTHTAGNVAPVTKTVTYGTVLTNLTGADKCWITQNLGADNQAASATDGTEAAAGWYWQFNREQGYKHDGTTRTPSTTWITPIDEPSDWTAANDPCTILLGSGWRILTSTEWTNADIIGSWTSYNDTYASVLKLHTAGYINLSGLLSLRGSNGYYWSSSMQFNTVGSGLYFHSGNCEMAGHDKAVGYSVRCLKD